MDIEEWFDEPLPIDPPIVELDVKEQVRIERRKVYKKTPYFILGNALEWCMGGKLLPMHSILWLRVGGSAIFDSFFAVLKESNRTPEKTRLARLYAELSKSEINISNFSIERGIRLEPTDPSTFEIYGMRAEVDCVDNLVIDYFRNEGHKVIAKENDLTEWKELLQMLPKYK